MAEERRVAIPGILDRVPGVCAFVVRAAESAGLDERAVYQCQMAVDEWCTNVIEHGYHDKGENGRIEIVCNIQPGQLAITVSDDSPLFDPTKLPDVDVSNPALQDRQPGGLGWFFIRKAMNVVYYQAKDGRNYLTMIKYSAQREATLGKSTEPMFPTHELRDGIWVVALSGRLDSSVGSLLEAALAAQLDAAHVRLVVDMSDVSYISSSGLKALVATWRSAQKRGGNVVLTGLNARVREVFEISGFDSLF